MNLAFRNASEAFEMHGTFYLKVPQYNASCSSISRVLSCKKFQLTNLYLSCEWKKHVPMRLFVSEEWKKQLLIIDVIINLSYNEMFSTIFRYCNFSTLIYIYVHSLGPEEELKTSK